MTKPWYQTLIIYTGLILSGIIIIGELIGAISNAKIITLKITWIGTFFLIFAWIFARLFLKRHPLRWVMKDGSEVYVKKLGVKITLPFLGILLVTTQWFRG